MNHWNNDQFMPPPMMGPGGVPPLVAPPVPMMDLASDGCNFNSSFIGPIAPNEGPGNSNHANMQGNEIHQDFSSGDRRILSDCDRRSNGRDRRDRRDFNRKERDRSNEGERRRCTRPNDRPDNHGTDRNDRGRPERREKRPSKWSDKEPQDNMGHPMMQGNISQGGMPPFNQTMMVDMNIMNMQQNMPGNMPPNIQGNNIPPAMQGNMPLMSVPGNMPMQGNMGNNMSGNMPPMGPNMQHMGNMPNMMPGMNMMPNMMESNMMMMNQPMIMQNQPLYFNAGMLLPSLPGVVIPPKREKPKGCRTIFVGGLPVNVNEDMLKEIFTRFGSIATMKLHRQGFCHIRYERPECVEASFVLSGFRFKLHDQNENEATTLFIDYALNRDDQNEYERSQRYRDSTPPRIEPLTAAAMSTITEKIKSEDKFTEAAPTLVGWLERGECNKKNSNVFYSLIQASNNQIRRLYNEKMQLDEEYENFKIQIKDKFAAILKQFEQVAKILSAAKHQRVSDHFSKQQRRNIEMWLKMTEDVENIREEFEANFDDEYSDKPNKDSVPAKKFDQLKMENEALQNELEGYKNEAFLARDEAERKFEKFKAHFIAQQALHGNNQFPPLPPPPMMNEAMFKPQPPPQPQYDDMSSGSSLTPTEAKLISILTAFLLVHPLGATLDYLVSYVRSLTPNVTQATVNNVLQRYDDIFQRKTSGVGASMEHRWGFVTFDIIKTECQ